MHTRYSNRLDFGPGLTSGSRNRSRKAGGVLIMFTIMLPFLLIPLVGLAIDATLMYSVRAKLQAAVDGGAIAAAQSLKSGINFTTQKAAAEKTADEFIKANFVVDGVIAGYHGYWGANNLNDCNGGSPCIVAAEDNLNKRRTVTVSATVQVPLLFMRIFGFGAGSVTARGTAARRDVVMVLVLDRSSSMDHVINGVNVRDAMKAGAAYFTTQFQSGRDRLGLVVFGGSAIVAYPPGDWNPAGAKTGPDPQFQDLPDSAAVPNMLRSISNVQISTNTGTAEALILAWKELQAANQPGALNVIVLFTDGQPNGITANFNINTVDGVIKGGSACNNKSVPLGPKSMIGWMAQWGNFVSGGTTNGHGIFGLAQTDNVTHASVTDWLITGAEPTLPSPPSAGCGYVADSSLIPSDLTKIPLKDIYGNSTQGSGSAPYSLLDYQQSEIWGNECKTGSRSAWDPTKTGDACQIGIASWNAADMAGKQIREDAVLTPVIYTMGFKGNGGDDPALMQRLSNVKGVSSVYDATKPVGLYLPIQVPNDITPAFQTVLAEILRLSM